MSAGYGIDLSKGWVELLKQRLSEQKYNYAVVNASISGDTTKNALARLQDLINSYSHAIYVIEVGGNDGLQGLPARTIENNLSQMVELILKHKQSLILVGVRIPPNYGEDYTKAFEKIYPKIAKKYHILLVPYFLEGIDSNRDLLQADGIHPTESVQSKMLENIWQQLIKILKK